MFLDQKEILQKKGKMIDLDLKIDLYSRWKLSHWTLILEFFYPMLYNEYLFEQNRFNKVALFFEENIKVEFTIQ